jgi:hypothetical protein
LKVGLNNAITGGVKTQAQAAFNTLRTQITSPHLQKSFVALIAFVLVFWWVFPLAQGDIPDWIALARAAQVWLLTWVVQFELHRQQERLDEVLRLKRQGRCL